MKKRDLLRQLAAIARTGGVDFHLLREGRNHEIWILGSERLVIPRHREINEHTARGILTEAGKMVEP
ncbi:type II toxin-antitoxin system HicA family toxin [Candidatus Poriferisodalis sp.]|uniref:type II toxin-antitoxin system HicA family toxin n=1 Tax=Candidatus Poriferisodalis sp. TaxID=3101277 RepID=UPI003D1438A1